MDLTSLIALSRNLAGDPAYEGNSPGWTDDEIVAALNWAQTRYAELTHCTYQEVAAPAASDANGIFTVPPGFILVDRVMIPDPPPSDLSNTTITPSMPSAPSGTSFGVSVGAVSGATFFWSVAGANLIAGQGLPNINVASPLPAGGVATISCLVTYMGQRVSLAVDVPIT